MSKPSKYILDPERIVERGMSAAVCLATKRLRGDPPVELSVDPEKGRVYVKVGTAETFVPIKRARDFFLASGTALAETIEDRDTE